MKSTVLLAAAALVALTAPALAVHAKSPMPTEEDCLTGHTSESYLLGWCTIAFDMTGSMTGTVGQGYEADVAPEANSDGVQRGGSVVASSGGRPLGQATCTMRSFTPLTPRRR